MPEGRFLSAASFVVRAVRMTTPTSWSSSQDSFFQDVLFLAAVDRLPSELAKSLRESGLMNLAVLRHYPRMTALDLGLDVQVEPSQPALSRAPRHGEEGSSARRL